MGLLSIQSPKITVDIEAGARAICEATREFLWDEEDEILHSQFMNEAKYCATAWGFSWKN